MRAHIPGRVAVLTLLLGGLACAGNKANTDNGTVVATDTTQVKDTSAYKGMDRDTTALPAPAPTAADTTQYQPQAAPAAPADTTSYAPTAPAAPTDNPPSGAMDSSGVKTDSVVTPQ